LSYCIIYQENLAAHISILKVESVMNNVIKIINYIRTKKLNHRKFKYILEEIKCNYSEEEKKYDKTIDNTIHNLGRRTYIVY